MLVESIINLENVERVNEPYEHFVKRQVLDLSVCKSLFLWFEESAFWNYHSIDRFYESFDINMRNQNLPQELLFITNSHFLNELKTQIETLYQIELQEKIDISASKLTVGQQIRIHTDVGPIGQTHRLIIHIINKWDASQGGLLLLFDQEDPSEFRNSFKIYIPENGTGLIFAINEKSFHAVSKVTSGNRYSLVYSFYEKIKSKA